MSGSGKRWLLTLLQPTKTILREIAQPEMKRKDVAMTYATCLTMAENEADWPMINRAIMNRWSRSGLEWIKREAWRRVQQRVSWGGGEEVR